jgi:hypothetical protein
MSHFKSKNESERNTLGSLYGTSVAMIISHEVFMNKTFKKLSQIAVLISLMVGANAFAIDDSMIFENIDTQNALHKEMRNGQEDSPEIKGALDKKIVVEERSTTIASPSNDDIFKFEKEKSSKKTVKKFNQKKKETLAQEMRDLVD